MNSNILKAFEAAGIDKSKAFAYLFLRKNRFDYSWLPRDIRRRVEMLTIEGKLIFESDAAGRTQWRIEPFEKAKEQYDEQMVKLVEYMRSVVRNINPSRVGDKKVILKKLDKFVKAYKTDLDTVKDIFDYYIYVESPSAEYVMSLNNFFYHQTKGSKAAQILEEIKKQRNERIGSAPTLKEQAQRNTL